MKNDLPLVLLHGFCEDASLWDGLLPMLGERPVFCPDLPGFGDAPVPEKPGMEVYADAVLAFLDGHDVEKCVLVGHSMGGYAALAFAEKYPERLAGFGLVHSHPYPDTPDRRENRRRGIELVRSGKKEQYVGQLFPALFPPAFAAANPDVVQRLVRRAQNFPAEGIALALEGMMERPSHEKTLGNAPCPVLFVVGTEDSLLERPLAEAMTALPPVADIHILEGVGHMGIFEAPEKVAAALRGFHALCSSELKN